MITSKRESSKLLRSLFLGGLAWQVSACTAKIEGGGSTDAPPSLNRFTDSHATIQGPAVSGTWKSKCVEARFGTGSRQILVTYTKDHVQKIQTNYTDSNCKMLKGPTLTNGIYRFIDKDADGGYTVEYNLDLGNSVHSHTQEKLWLENDQLFLSDYAVGSAVSKSQSIAFDRDNGGTHP
jgi:hypothetical protein